MANFRKLLALIAVLGLLIPAAGFAAPEMHRRPSRGIVISQIGLAGQSVFGANVRWVGREMRGGRANTLGVALVATTGGDGVSVFNRTVPASAQRPERDYALSLNSLQQALVDEADGLGLVATQRVGLNNGRYQRAWVSHEGAFPSVVGGRLEVRPRARCSPVQSGGSYPGCYYGYTDLSDMDLHNATFTDAQFPFSTLTDTNFGNADLSYAMFGYANLANANLSNANMTGAYLFGANMKGANLTGTILTNAQFCNTIMPNGTVSNANC